MGLVAGIEGKTAATLTPPLVQSELTQERIATAQLRAQLQTTQAQLDAALAEVARLKSATPSAPVVTVRVDESVTQQLDAFRAEVEREVERTKGLAAENAALTARLNARGIEVENLTRNVESLTRELADLKSRGGKRR